MSSTEPLFSVGRPSPGVLRSWVERIVQARLSSQPDVAPGLWTNLREDLSNHQGDWTQAGFQALALHRIRHASVRSGRLGRAICPLVDLARIFVRNVYSIELAASADIGRGVVIAHQGAIVVADGASIGDGCLIRQGVSIERAPEGSGGSPKLGMAVEIGAGAMLIGAIAIGERVKIGPNAVVTTDIPTGHLVFATPARTLLIHGNHDRLPTLGTGRGGPTGTSTLPSPARRRSQPDWPDRLIGPQPGPAPHGVMAKDRMARGGLDDRKRTMSKAESISDSSTAIPVIKVYAYPLTRFTHVRYFTASKMSDVRI